MNGIKRIGLAFAIAIGFASSTKAGLIMDQIGGSPAFVNGQGGDPSQIFAPPSTPFNSAVVDNFSITGGAKNLTEVDAALVGFNNFTSYANITAYDVAIYSSIAAAARNLTGNVANVSIAPGSVVLTNPYGAYPTFFPALAAIPINVTLGVGTYFVAVIPHLDSFVGGQINVSASIFPGFPSDSNAFQVNPNGGFNFTGNQSALNVNAAYRIFGTDVPLADPVPEPATFGMAAIAGVVGLIAYRRRKRTD